MFNQKHTKKTEMETKILKMLKLLTHSIRCYQDTPLNKTKLINSFIFRAVRDLSRPVDHTVGIKCLIFKTEKYVLSSPEVVSFMKKII